jgi:hypothetical protein
MFLVLASRVILGSKPLGTHNHVLVSQIRDPPTWRDRVAQSYPQALGYLIVASYDSQGHSGSIRTRLSTRV